MPRAGAPACALGPATRADARLDLALDAPPDAHGLPQQRAHEGGAPTSAPMPSYSGWFGTCSHSHAPSDAGHDRDGEADVHAAQQARAVRLAQVRADDADDQEGLDAFPERHEQGLQHGRGI